MPAAALTERLRRSAIQDDEVAAIGDFLALRHQVGVIAGLTVRDGAGAAELMVKNPLVLEAPESGHADEIRRIVDSLGFFAPYFFWRFVREAHSDEH